MRHQNALNLDFQLFLGEAPFALLFGLIIGPHCLDFFDPREWISMAANRPYDPTTPASNHASNYLTLELMRVVLATGVFAIGVALPAGYVKAHWRSLGMLLGPVMGRFSS